MSDIPVIVNPPEFCDLDKAQASLTERFAEFGLTTSDFDFVLTTAEDTTGREDTVLVTEDRDFVLAACFDRYANPDVPDMLHCHAPDHEETGMTGQFQALRGWPRSSSCGQPGALADRVAHLRVEGLVGCARYCEPMGRPDISQIRGVAIGRAIAAKLRAEPDLLSIGRTNLRRFRAMDTPGQPWLDEWQARIDAGVESVAEVLEADTEHGHDMRQMAPFAGVLTVRERDAVLREVYGVRRTDFAHAVRAAGALLHEDVVLAVGSQALWGWVGDDIETLPEPAARSREADIASLDDPDERKSHLLSGALGEESMFDQTFGYFVDEVSATT